MKSNPKLARFSWALYSAETLRNPQTREVIRPSGLVDTFGSAGAALAAAELIHSTLNDQAGDSALLWLLTKALREKR